MARINSQGQHTPLIVPEQGTGLSTLAAGSFLVAGSTSTANMTGSAVVNVGDLLISRGSSLAPIATNQNACGSEKLLTSTNITSSTAQVTFFNIDSTYFAYKIRVFNAIPSTTSTTFLLRTSSNGSTFDSGSTDYFYWLTVNPGSGAVYTSGNQGFIRLDYNSVDQTAAGSNYFEITLINPSTSQVNPGVIFKGRYYDQGQTGMVYLFGHGRRATTAIINGIQIRFAGPATIASGLFNLYGIY